MICIIDFDTSSHSNPLDVFATALLILLTSRRHLASRLGTYSNNWGCKLEAEYLRDSESWIEEGGSSLMMSPGGQSLVLVLTCLLSGSDVVNRN